MHLTCIRFYDPTHTEICHFLLLYVYPTENCYMMLLYVLYDMFSRTALKKYNSKKNRGKKKTKRCSKLFKFQSFFFKKNQRVKWHVSLFSMTLYKVQNDMCHCLLWPAVYDLYGRLLWFYIASTYISAPVWFKFACIKILKTTGCKVYDMLLEFLWLPSHTCMTVYFYRFRVLGLGFWVSGFGF